MLRLTHIFGHYLSLIICIFFHFDCHSQSPQFKNYSIREGLPSSETYAVIQDSKGYIWAASDKGVARFDGYQFRIFTINEGLTDNTVFKIIEDHKGRIWFSTYTGGICYYDYFLDKIIALESNSKLIQMLSGKIIFSLNVDNEDIIWLGVFDSGVAYKIDLNANLENQIAIDKSYPQIGAFLIEQNNDKYIIGTSVKSPDPKLIGFSIFSKGKKHVVNGFNNYKFSSPNMYYVKSNEQNFLISFNNHVYKVVDYNVTAAANFPKNVIYLYKDRNNYIWTGVAENGVYVYLQENMEEKKVNYLPKLSVTGILEDREGGYWFSTLEEGLFYMKEKAYIHYTTETGLSTKKISCIALSESSELYAGSINGEVNVISSDEIKRFNIISSDAAYLNNSINTILVEKNRTQIGGRGHFLIENNHKEIVKNHQEKSQYSTTTIIKNRNKKNTYWIGGETLLKFERNDGKNISFDLNFNYRINALCDNSEELWIGARNGLWSYDGIVFKYWGNENELFKTRITDLKTDSLGNLWIATRGKGIAIKRGNKLYSINERSGLLSNICQSICFNSDGNLWVGTNKGINEIEIKSWQPLDFNIKKYTSQDGIISNEINQLLVNNNNVYVATNQGITIFDKTKVLSNVVPPLIYLTRVFTNDSNLSIHKGHVLSHDQNSITFNYVGLTYKNDGNTPYKYRLIGLDSNWYFTNYTSQKYNTLPYGNYTFEVSAQNNDGIWSNQLAVMNITVEPPWWHTWWFRITGGLIFISILNLGIKSRIRIIEKREKEKTALYKLAAETEKEKSILFQKASEMELKFLSAQINPHFTFNAMNSIQHFIVNNESSTAQNYLAKYSKLIRLVLQNTMKKYIPIEDEIMAIKLYLQIESMRFAKSFEYTITISDELNDDLFEVPPMIIQPFIENSLWHGLMNKKNEEGKILLAFTLEQNHIKCIIEDNGIGRVKASQIKKTNTSHQSFGMIITQQRLKNLHGDVHANFQTRITDLYDSLGKATGTRVEISLPINNS